MSMHTEITDLHGKTIEISRSESSECVFLSGFGSMGAQRFTAVLPHSQALALATALINAAEGQRQKWADR